MRKRSNPWREIMTMRRVLICWLSLVLPTACGDPGEPEPAPSKITQAIQGGRDSEAPFSVGLDMRMVRSDGLPGSAQCSGVALSPHWILTAAHCMKTRDGAYDVTSPGGKVFRQISATQTGQQVFDGDWQWSVPSGYNAANLAASTPFDIAIVRLSGAGLSATPESWGLLYDDDPSRLFQYLTTFIEVAGWGWSNYLAPDSCPLDLLKPRSGFLSKPVSWYNAIRGVQNLGANLCGGDSGGPWFTWFDTKEITFGLSSGTPGPATPNCGTKKCIPPGSTVEGPMVTFWTSWIISNSSSPPHALTCTRLSTVASNDQTYYYRSCVEAP
jgi:hypothetical protein